ncbi:MAG: hypothetical protein QM528_01955 [Phycisphaerales bacterium]|nr:hypothetical protein [Phycisphaerales bacterium]
MKQLLFKIIVTVFIVLIGYPAFAVKGKIRVGLYLPLYLDSIVHNGYSWFADNPYPDYMNPGISFYNGVMLASQNFFSNTANSIDVYVLDSKSSLPAQNKWLNSKEALSLDFMIAMFSNKEEMKRVSDWGLLKNTPVLSVTFPSAAGIKNNPYFYVLNPSLQFHLGAIFKLLLNQYADDNIIMLTKDGAMEQSILQFFEHQNQFLDTAEQLHYQTCKIEGPLSLQTLLPYFKYNQQNILVCASTNIDFGITIDSVAEQYSRSNLLLIGMPNWDKVTALRNPLNNIPICYSKSLNFYSDNKMEAYRYFSDLYKKKFYALPNEYTSLGYDVFNHFVGIANVSGADFVNQLSSSLDTVFTTYQFVPRYVSPYAIIPDFFENTNISFIHLVGNTVANVIPASKF